MNTVIAIHTIITGIGAEVLEAPTNEFKLPVMLHPAYPDARDDMLNAQFQAAMQRTVGLVDAYQQKLTIDIDLLERFERELSLVLYPSLMPHMHQTVSTLISLLRGVAS